MPQPSPLACTAAAPPEPPPTPAAAPPTKKVRGNPNLALAPRCGARTRAGCPCRSPAISGKQRCRMHGGRSTGPRTAEGRARIAAARTTHGRYGARWRAHNRRILSIARRGRVFRAALQYLERLPPDLAARFAQNPPELRMPPYTTGGTTAAQDRAMQRAEAEALAPWKQAIALARHAGRAARPPGSPLPTATPQGRSNAKAKPHAPVPAQRDPGSPAQPVGGTRANSAQEPHTPEHAVLAPAAPIASPTAAAVAQAKPHAPVPAQRGPGSPEQSVGGARANSAQEPRTPEHAVPAPVAPIASPLAAVVARAKAHAPEWMACARDNRPTTPPALPEPHAPVRSLAAVTPPRLSGRAARRWLRRQKSKHQALAGPRAGHPLPQTKGEC
jgi:hypothetical protein